MGSSVVQIQLIHTCTTRIPYTIHQVLFLLEPRPRAVRFCRRAQAVTIRCRVARCNFPSGGRRRRSRRGKDRHGDGTQRSNPMTMLVFHTLGGVTWDSCLPRRHTPFHAHCVHVRARMSNIDDTPLCHGGWLHATMWPSAPCLPLTMCIASTGRRASMSSR